MTGKLTAQRKAVYEAARQQHPERWSGATRNWEPAGQAWLNPDRPQVVEGLENERIAA